MNLLLCQYWGAADELSEEDYLELYKEKLFVLKKSILDQSFVPKLMRKKMEECSKILQIIAQDKHFVMLDQYPLKDLNEFEKLFSEIRLSVHQSLDFEDLFLSSNRLLALMEGYRNLIALYTEVWGEEWKTVEVNSRDVFPSGVFLYSLKQGKSIEDWKDALLKERKRITIVF